MSAAVQLPPWLTSVEIAELAVNGYLLLPALFSRSEVAALKVELEVMFASGPDGHQAGVDVLWAPHERSSIFRALNSDPRTLGLSQTLLNDAAYPYRSKLHRKRPGTADTVDWHQDFKRWHFSDGMKDPRVTSLVLALDPMDDENGGLRVIPKSHRRGLLPDRRSRNLFADLAAHVNYRTDPDAVAWLSAEVQPVTIWAESGSLIVLDPNLVHGSGPNLSNRERDVAVIAYNAVSNILEVVDSPRDSRKARSTPSFDDERHKDGSR